MCGSAVSIDHAVTGGRVFGMDKARKTSKRKEKNPYEWDEWDRNGKNLKLAVESGQMRGLFVLVDGWVTALID